MAYDPGRNRRERKEGMTDVQKGVLCFLATAGITLLVIAAYL